MTNNKLTELRYGNNVQSLLSELASYDAADIDGDEFEVYGEDSNGLEGSATISITELAADAAKLLGAQEAELQKRREASKPQSDDCLGNLLWYAREATCHSDPNYVCEYDRLAAPGVVASFLEELQEYRKASQSLSDPERQELIKLRHEDALRRQQWAQGMQHDPTFGGILPKL